MTTQLIIPAAGSGERLGLDIPKALAPLANVPILIRTLQCFEPLGLLDNAIIIAPPAHTAEFEAALELAFPETTFHCIDGGAERQLSVINGLDATDPDTKWIVIHDAARPFVDREAISATIEAAKATGAATLAAPCADTILEDDGDQMLTATPDRSRLWACQTPQVFKADLLKKAHEAARRAGNNYTDDATLVHENGSAVKIVQGGPENFKITSRADLAYAEYLLKEGDQ